MSEASQQNQTAYVVFVWQGGAVINTTSQHESSSLNLPGCFCVVSACFLYNWTNLNVFLLFHVVKKVIKSVTKSSQSLRISKVSS